MPQPAFPKVKTYSVETSPNVFPAYLVEHSRNAMAPAEDFVVNPHGDVTIAELRCVLRVALKVGHKVWMAI